MAFRDEGLKVALDQWKNFGITGPESVERVGPNAKMNEFCAAMGICNLRHLDDEIAKRERVFLRYAENLEGVAGCRMLARQTPGVRMNYAYFPIVFEAPFGSSRDEVFERLGREGYASRKYFHPLATSYSCYKGRFDGCSTPNAERAAASVLTLPMYADLELDDVDAICRIIRSCR